MYIAGLNLTLTSTPTSLGVIEPIICTTLLVSLSSFMRYVNQRLESATAKGGEIKRMPTSLLGKVITPIQVSVTALTPILYLCSLPLYGFRQPEWFARTALPDLWLAELGLGETGKAVMRLASMAVALWSHHVAQKSVEQLDKQFHYIGVREKPKIVDTGLYGIVRHPFYSTALITQVAYVGVMWNYYPLLGAAAGAAAFAVKIAIEENLLLTDENVALDYREYQKKVPYRLIPYIW